VILRVYRNIDESRLVVNELHELPRGPAVGRFVKSALGVRVPRVAEGRHVHDVWIGGIYHDAADLLRRFEAHEFPGPSRVGRLEESATGRNRVARIFLARARVDDTGVGRRESDVSHGDHSLLVEQREEHRAGVDGLPDAAGCGRDVEDLRIAGNSFDIGDAAGHIGRTDRPPAETGQRGRIERSRELRGNGAGTKKKCAGESGKDGVGSHLIG